MENMNNALKLTAASENMKELYKSPSVKVIETAPESVLCQSTEGYGMNGQSLGDSDFE